MHEMKEMVGGCCVCLKDDGWDEDPLVFCDGHDCNLAVHKNCYGIVTVPSGPWYCTKCESQETDAIVSCELCPSKTGALKRTDNGKWAHILCALYIPEVGFGNLATMEPIVLNSTPPDRFNKSCCICENQGNESSSKIGACMDCNKPGCRNQFHVTCAHTLGLLCEEAGNFSAVLYCGYCPHHLSQMKKRTKLKTVPTFKSPSAAAGPSDPALKQSSSLINRSLEQSSGSSSTKNEIKERKRKKNSCKPSSSAGNGALTTSEFSPVLAGVGLTPKPSIQESEIDQGNFTETLTQEADRNAGSKKRSKFPKFAPRVSSLIRRLSAPAMVSVKHTSTPISPKTERTTSQENSAKSGASFCSSNDNESASIPEVESLTSVIGPSTSVEMTFRSTSDVGHLAVCATAGGSRLNNPSSIGPMSTEETVTELHREPVAAPLPKMKKPLRNRAPKAPPLTPSSLPRSPVSTAEKHSSKRRKKEEEEIPEKAASSTVDTISADDLHPEKTEPKQPETITRSALPSNFHLLEHFLPEAPQIHLQTSSPGSLIATKSLATPLTDRPDAPQMLGNELNLDSSTAIEMSDLLSAELVMHNVFTDPSPTPSTSSYSLVDVPLPRRNVSSAIKSTMAALSSAPAPHHLADLLERQWEQGSQFLMEQAQHYDVASLLSGLHEIRQGNAQLQDHVADLIQRRDRLLAVNARLSVPLTVQPVTHTSFVTNSGNQPERTSLAEKGNNTEQLPSYIGTFSRVDKIHHPVHPTSGLPSTISPVQGSTGFSSFTPEMAQSTGTPTTEQQLHRLGPYPMSVSALSGQHSVNVRREMPDGRQHYPLALG